MGRNLGPLNIKDSYEGLVQISGSQLTNGSGSLIPSLEVTSSYATTAISASYAVTASYAENAGASTLQQVLDTGNNATGSIVLKNNEASIPALQINSPTGTSSTLLRLSRLVDDANNFVVTAGDASNATLSMGNSGGFGQISLNGSGANKIQATTKLSIDTPSLTVTGSLSVTGSVKGNVVVLTTAASATTMDCSLGNFFTLAMPSGGFTNLTPTNITAGQTISVKITQNATPSSLSFAPAIVFDNASPFVVSSGAGFVDVITFISFDGTSLQATGLKNFQ